jgi:hypothetical protein
VRAAIGIARRHAACARFRINGPMKKKLFASLMFAAVLAICSAPLAAAIWIENPADPIYNPFPATTLPEDYFPIVVYDGSKFSAHGDAYFYKMWHQGTDGIALSYSNDGINWTFNSNVISGSAFHPCVIYDRNGFGGGAYYYKAWYWTGTPATTVGVIQFSQSTDGITWTAPTPVTQDPSFPLVDGISPGYFYHLYGPGAVLYNPVATSTPGQPFTYPYQMFYDTSSEGFGPGGSVEQIGLAYSSDGLNWTRYGSEPILIPSGAIGDWDGTHAFRPSVVRVTGTYYMLYSGSNDNIDPVTSVSYAHGIGLATSTDGIHWTKSASNPVFSYANGVAWRNSRTYAPSVLLSPNGLQLQMWFSGGSGLTAGTSQGIGYATLSDFLASSVSQSVPMLSQWHLVFLTLLLGAAGFRHQRRRCIF